VPHPGGAFVLQTVQQLSKGGSRRQASICASIDGATRPSQPLPLDLKPGSHTVSFGGKGGRSLLHYLPEPTAKPKVMLEISLKKQLQRLGRFTVAGGLNTIIGTLAIFSLQALTSNPRISNFIGYVIGGIAGYFLHARYTFTASVSRRSFGIFGCVAVISFLVNQLVLSYALKFFAAFIAQALAILSYAFVSYALQSRLVFPDGNRKASYHAKLNQPR